MLDVPVDLDTPPVLEARIPQAAERDADFHLVAPVRQEYLERQARVRVPLSLLPLVSS